MPRGRRAARARKLCGSNKRRSATHTVCGWLPGPWAVSQRAGLRHGLEAACVATKRRIGPRRAPGTQLQICFFLAQLHLTWSRFVSTDRILMVAVLLSASDMGVMVTLWGAGTLSDVTLLRKFCVGGGREGLRQAGGGHPAEGGGVARQPADSGCLGRLRLRARAVAGP